MRSRAWSLVIERIVPLLIDVTFRRISFVFPSLVGTHVGGLVFVSSWVCSKEGLFPREGRMMQGCYLGTKLGPM